MIAVWLAVHASAMSAMLLLLLVTAMVHHTATKAQKGDAKEDAAFRILVPASIHEVLAECDEFNKHCGGSASTIGGAMSW